MQLTEREQQTLEENIQILELQKNESWKLFRKRIETSIKRIRAALGNKRQLTWDAYLCLWYRKEALESLLATFDGLPTETEALSKKALAKPDNRPATGALA